MIGSLTSANEWQEIAQSNKKGFITVKA
jgi:hypothetical protein